MQVITIMNDAIYYTYNYTDCLEMNQINTLKLYFAHLFLANQRIGQEIKFNK